MDLVQGVINGVNLLIEMEKRLEQSKTIDDLIPKDIPEEELQKSKALAEVSKLQNQVEEYHMYLHR